MPGKSALVPLTPRTKNPAPEIGSGATRRERLFRPRCWLIRGDVLRRGFGVELIGGPMFPGDVRFRDIAVAAARGLARQRPKGPVPGVGEVQINLVLLQFKPAGALRRSNQCQSSSATPWAALARGIEPSCTILLGDNADRRVEIHNRAD